MPVAADAIRAIVNKFTNGAGAKPANIQEAIALKEAETKQLLALAELDKPAGDISRWVADLRASFRYVAAGCIIISTFGLIGLEALQAADVPDDVMATMLEMAGSVFSFMFGDRVYSHLKAGRKK
jgi:hypothetical protein